MLEAAAAVAWRKYFVCLLHLHLVRFYLSTLCVVLYLFVLIFILFFFYFSHRPRKVLKSGWSQQRARGAQTYNRPGDLGAKLLLNFSVYSARRIRYYTQVKIIRMYRTTTLIEPLSVSRYGTPTNTLV